MTVVIGKNGVGKSMPFDAFGFLADFLKSGVEEACDSRGRGGYDRIKDQGAIESIEFEIYYKEDGNARPITYELAIDLDASGRHYVQKEWLRQRLKVQKHGWPFSFLVLNNGKGVVWKEDTEGRQILVSQLFHTGRRAWSSTCRPAETLEYPRRQLRVCLKRHKLIGSHPTVIL